MGFIEQLLGLAIRPRSAWKNWPLLFGRWRYLDFFQALAGAGLPNGWPEGKVEMRVLKRILRSTL